MFRYCGQTNFFLKRMNDHFGENATHNPIFAAHFKTCKDWLKIVPVAKTLNFQADRNFIEIDVISALKCCDTFSGGFNFLAGGQYNVKTEKKQQELEKRLQDVTGVLGTTTKKSAEGGVDIERLSTSSSSSSDSDSSSSSSYSSSSDSSDSDSSCSD